MNTTITNTKYKQTEIGLIPEDWDDKSIDEITVEKGLIRGPFGGALKKAFFVKDGYKVYTQGNAIYKTVNLGEYYINQAKFQELNRFKIYSNDFILSCSGTIGKIFRIPHKHPEGIINQALLIIRVDKNIVDLEYFEQVFNSQEVKNRIIDDTQGVVCPPINRTISF